MTDTDRSPNFGVILFTLIEVGAVTALLIERTVLMVAVVLVAFLAEHVVSYNVKRVGRSLFDLDGLPLKELAFMAGLETATWAVWLRLAADGLVVESITVLVVGLLLGHMLERNVGAGLGLLDDVGRRVRESLDFTGIETATGILWLLLIGVNGLLAAAVLAVGLYVEHRISLRRPVEVR